MAKGVHATLTNHTQIMQAIAHLRTAAHWGIAANPWDDRRRAELNYQVAAVQVQMKRASEAEQSLRDALAVDPGYVMAHFDLGALLLEKGAINESVFHFRAAVAARPDFADGHYNLGLAYWMTGAEEEARRELEWALRLNPDDAQTRELHERMHHGNADRGAYDH